MNTNTSSNNNVKATSFYDLKWINLLHKHNGMDTKVTLFFFPNYKIKKVEVFGAWVQMGENNTWIYEIWGFHGSEISNWGRLCYDAM